MAAATYAQPLLTYSYINHLAVISHDSEVVNNINGQQRPRTSIIIRLSVTLVAWRGSSFGRDSQPMLISAHNLKKQKKNRISF